MKQLAIRMVIMLLKQVLLLDVIHQQILDLAKKSDNKIDDLAAKRLVDLLKEIVPLL